MDFIPFNQPISLTDVFAVRREALERYLVSNTSLGPEKRGVFYVRQSGRLQCLNGAYLSEVDGELLDSLFGLGARPSQVVTSPLPLTVETGTQLTIVKARLGQSVFASRVKDLYGHKCCFPGCPVEDRRFLVASHIARWSDNEQLRGNVGNGLCLCLMHDKAFELGLFTVDERFRVFLNPREVGNTTRFACDLQNHHGQQIRLASVRPLSDALLEHWIRVDISP